MNAKPKKLRGNKVPIALSLSPDAHDMLLALSEASGLSKSGVVEIAVRDKAKSAGITIDQA